MTKLINVPAPPGSGVTAGKNRPVLARCSCRPREPPEGKCRNTQHQRDSWSGFPTPTARWPVTAATGIQTAGPSYYRRPSPPGPAGFERSG